ncbi:restriction endonuclease, partial [Vibrio sp. V34_P3A8T189]|uniref:restriction endonuclease n=2 Tax=unclassified Vibrio TaxID=2614977 RepID=UPI003FCFA50B
MQSNGRQGQKQNGVDCFGKQKFSDSWTGIQCKRKQTYPENELTFKEVIKEVNQAKGFNPRLEHLIIATTFRRCSKLQEQVRELSDELESNGYFTVSIAFWDDIEKLLNKNKVVAKEYY